MADLIDQRSLDLFRRTYWQRSIIGDHRKLRRLDRHLLDSFSQDVYKRQAYKTIVRGGADIMYTGGTEAAITPLAFASFSAAKTLSTHNDEPQKASRPFDLNRDGFVMGEGAAVLVLEELEHALARNAEIYAEVAGYGFMADAYHITSPAPDGIGARNAMQEALDDAKITAEQIDYINAHGTSTHLNDQIETLAIKEVRCV